MIDINILLDWLLDRDHKIIIKIDHLYAKSKTIHITDIILVKLAFALGKYYELPQTLIVNNTTKVLEQTYFKCNRVMLYPTLTLYLEHKSFSFVDVASFSIPSYKTTRLFDI